MVIDDRRDDLRSGQELEIKFTCDAKSLAQAKEVILPPSSCVPRIQNLRTIYFDTLNCDLQRGEFSLRIREQEGCLPIMGLKSVGTMDESVFKRNEIEVPTDGVVPDINLFDQHIAKQLRIVVGKQQLRAVFATEIKRTSATLSHGNAEIEVAIDDGEIVVGDKRAPICDVEFELKAGDEAELCAFAMDIVTKVPLSLAFVSKAERGFKLSTGEIAQPKNAQAINLTSLSTVDEAITSILSNTLVHFVSNWAALREGNDPETIHQMRISLRRMRSGIFVFKKALPHQECTHFMAETKRIAGFFATARSLDVFLKVLSSDTLSNFGSKTERGKIEATIERQRLAAYATVRAQLETSQMTLFALGMQSLIARKPWRNNEFKSNTSLLQQASITFAKKALTRLEVKAQRRGKHIARLPDRLLHKLRIALKNLRYASEFFGSAFNGSRKWKAYLNRLKSLQDSLGKYNDMSNLQMAIRQPPFDLLLSQRSKLFAAKHDKLTTATNRKKIIKAWKAFTKVDKFW